MPDMDLMFMRRCSVHTFASVSSSLWMSLSGACLDLVSVIPDRGASGSVESGAQTPQSQHSGNNGRGDNILSSSNDFGAPVDGNEGRSERSEQPQSHSVRHCEGGSLSHHQYGGEQDRSGSYGNRNEGMVNVSSPPPSSHHSSVVEDENSSSLRSSTPNSIHREQQYGPSPQGRPPIPPPVSSSGGHFYYSRNDDYRSDHPQNRPYNMNKRNEYMRLGYDERGRSCSPAYTSYHRLEYDPFYRRTASPVNVNYSSHGHENTRMAYGHERPEYRHSSREDDGHGSRPMRSSPLGNGPPSDGWRGHVERHPHDYYGPAPGHHDPRKYGYDMGGPSDYRRGHSGPRFDDRYGNWGGFPNVDEAGRPIPGSGKMGPRSAETYSHTDSQSSMSSVPRGSKRKASTKDLFRDKIPRRYSQHQSGDGDATEDSDDDMKSNETRSKVKSARRTLKGDTEDNGNTTRIDECSKAYLKSWLFEHLHFPYPTEEEKKYMREYTGLSRGTLIGWFVNARRRLLDKTVHPDNTVTYQIKKKGGRTKFDEETVSFLKEWLLNHVDSPYPSKEDKQKISEMSGLSKDTIETWFNNARQQILVRHVDEKTGVISYSVRPIPQKVTPPIRPLEDEGNNGDLEEPSQTDMQNEEVTNVDSGEEASGKKEGGAQKTTKRSTFTPKSTKMLKNWLYRYKNNPYPNEEEKDMMCSKLGLSKTALDAWFINSRRRYLVKVVPGDFTDTVYEIKNKKAGRTEYDKDTIKMLKRWVFEHLHSPYPNKAEKQMLREQSQMSKEQLDVWFNNVRSTSSSLLEKRKGSDGKHEFRVRDEHLVEARAYTPSPELFHSYRNPLKK
eukprot:Nk52_evm6s1837 gene=Nk52_evmTU6s1837